MIQFPLYNLMFHWRGKPAVPHILNFRFIRDFHEYLTSGCDQHLTDF